MTLGQTLLREAMDHVARQIFGQTNHGQVEVRLFLDGDQPVAR